MKKIILTTITFIYFFGITNAQESFSGSGDNKFSVGLTPWGYGNGISGSYDYGLTDIFSVGAGAEFYFHKKSNDDVFYLFGRANAHIGSILKLPKEMDVYPGLDIGFRSSGLGLGGHLGFRYMFTDNLGGYIEVGSRGSLGVVIGF